MHWRCPTLTLATILLLNGALFADKTVQKEESSFGSIKSPDATEVRNQADAWLRSVGKADAATLTKVNTVWASDRPLLDKVSATLALGDADAARLLAEARDAERARADDNAGPAAQRRQEAYVLPRKSDPGLRQGADDAARSTKRPWTPSPW